MGLHVVHVRVMANMDLLIRPDVLASLDKLGQLVDKARADWDNHLQRVEAELDLRSQNPQITSSTNVVHDLDVVRTKCNSVNARLRGLRSRGLRPSEILVDQLVTISKPASTSTETRAWYIKRTLGEAEDTLDVCESGLKVREQLVDVKLSLPKQTHILVTKFEKGEMPQAMMQYA